MIKEIPSKSVVNEMEYMLKCGKISQETASGDSKIDICIPCRIMKC